MVLPGGEVSAWKDVVVTRDGDGWLMWACEHLLDRGDDEADRMRSVFPTSDDGLDWVSNGPARSPTISTWDARGTRITSAWESDGKWAASYDGRASAAENFCERTGFAVGAGPADFSPVAGPFDRRGRTLRYVTIAAARTGLRPYYEAGREAGANELLTTFVPFDA